MKQEDRYFIVFAVLLIVVMLVGITFSLAKVRKQLETPATTCIIPPN